MDDDGRMRDAPPPAPILAATSEQRHLQQIPHQMVKRGVATRYTSRLRQKHVCREQNCRARCYAAVPKQVALLAQRPPPALVLPN